MKRILLTLSSIVLGIGILPGISAQNKILKADATVENCGPHLLKGHAVSPKDDNGSIDFGYSAEPYTSYKMNNVTKGTAIYMCTEIDVTMLESLKGCKITGITTYGGVNTTYWANPDKNQTLFISTDLSKAPVYTQPVVASIEAMGANTFALNTPFEITGNTPIYVGFSVIAGTLTQYTTTVDGLPTSFNSCMVGLDNKGGYPASFSNQSSQIGSLCLSMQISGNNLPDNAVLLKDMVNPISVLQSAPEFELMARNNGREMKTATFTLTAGETSITFDRNFTDPIESGIEDIEFVSDAIANLGNQAITITLDKVNGKPNIYASSTVRCHTVVSPSLEPRNLVMEEATGTWCGWCPGGIVMMEKLKEKFGDRVNRIAVHTDDVMAISSYNGFLSAFVTGVPAAILNRSLHFTPSSMDEIESAKDAAEQLLKIGTYVKTKLERVSYDEEKNTITLDATTIFNVDNIGNHYVSVAIVEDGVGPYTQNNSFAGSLTKMDGWEKKSSSVTTVYEDVARALTGYPGLAISSTPIEANKEYVNTFEIDLSKISEDKSKDDDFRAIMMVTNANKEIVASTGINTSKSSVKNISEDTIQPIIRCGYGRIEVTNAKNVAIYSMTGAKIANGSVRGIPAGIYVVKADNLVKKVIVR